MENETDDAMRRKWDTWTAIWAKPQRNAEKQSRKPDCAKWQRLSSARVQERGITSQGPSGNRGTDVRRSPTRTALAPGGKDCHLIRFKSDTP